jgi:hypothetical protein
MNKHDPDDRKTASHAPRPNAPPAAYSEFVPPPRLGPKPFGTVAVDPRIDGDPFGWAVTEHEEAVELRPVLATLARRIVGTLAHLGGGQPAHGILRHKLEGNPYWLPALAKAAGQLSHERYVTLLPLALARQNSTITSQKANTRTGS